MKKVITYQHYLNKYKGHNPNLTATQVEKDSFAKEIAKIPFNYFSVIRPKKTKLTEKTIEGFMHRWICSYDQSHTADLELVFYTMEKDFEKNWYHANILIKGRAVTRTRLARSMKRTVDEVGYLEKIDSMDASAIYVNKHFGRKQMRLGRGLVDVEYAIDEKLFKNDLGWMHFDNHPNKEYHTRQKIISKFAFGWPTLPLKKETKEYKYLVKEKTKPQIKAQEQS